MARDDTQLNATGPSLADQQPVTTSLAEKLANILVSPGYVFDEVVRSPHRVSNWLVPMILACLTGLLLLRFATSEEQKTNGLHKLVQNEVISSTQAETLSTAWGRTSILGVCSSVLVGTTWSALILWALGRYLLRARFSFGKALEVAGLTQSILILGSLVTLLLIAASGDPLARPALSFFAGRLLLDNPVRMLLDSVNVFYVWTAVVLAVGLSRLSGVSAKQAGFWVLGYWIVLRAGVVLLA